MKAKKGDLLICICLAVILSVFLFEMKHITPAARIYPMVILVCCYTMITVAVVIWFKQKKSGRIDEGEDVKIGKKRLIYISVYCISIYGYIFLIDKLGYVLSTAVFGIFSLAYMKNKNKAVIILFPIVCAVFMQFVFSKFLYIKLPSGIF